MYIKHILHVHDYIPEICLFNTYICVIDYIDIKTPKSNLTLASHQCCGQRIEQPLRLLAPLMTGTPFCKRTRRPQSKWWSSRPLVIVAFGNQTWQRNPF